MSKQKKDKTPVLVTSESLEDFFARGRRTAQLLDQGKAVQSRRIISFEDPSDLVKFLTKNKLKLVSSVRKKPSSVSKLAITLKRSRSAVDKDIQELESVGIIKSTYVVNPGHGRCKMIMAADKEPVKLQVQAVI
ncbi:MAG TPA: HTH domain-containing protein [Gammaproteobacteria bacterium]|nr:HTH domain-containing protein [Gammaproteobacteria bacterium]